MNYIYKEIPKKIIIEKYYAKNYGLAVKFAWLENNNFTHCKSNEKYGEVECLKVFKEGKHYLSVFWDEKLYHDIDSYNHVNL